MADWHTREEDFAQFRIDGRFTASATYACSSCSRAFTTNQALTTHQSACSKVKQTLSQALGNLHKLAKRRSKSEVDPASLPALPPAILSTSEDSPSNEPTVSAGSALDSDIAAASEIPTQVATGRPRRSRTTVPKRFIENRSEETERPFPKRRRLVSPDASGHTKPSSSLQDISSASQTDSSSALTSTVPAVELSTATATATATSLAETPRSDTISQLVSQNPPQLLARSNCDIFGLYRQYLSSAPPTHDPDRPLSDSEDGPSNIGRTAQFHTPVNPYYPYPNWTSFRLGKWYWDGSATKSESSFQELLEILLDPGFDRMELRGTKWRDVNRRLASEDITGMSGQPDQWCETPVTLSVPLHKRATNPGIHNFEVTSLWHRKLLPAIRARLVDPDAFSHFHLEPYRLLWESGDPAMCHRVYGEAYTSQAFIDAHEELQRSSREPGCDLQRVVVALMFASDQTHLTDFGHDKLWPLYMAFGNESKYRRAELSPRAFDHVAYFCSLPPIFKDILKEELGAGVKFTDGLATHCHRELFHAQWEILLDDDFVHAYEHGFVIRCCDGVLRRFYPRIFSYSADYPEKVLIASIRNLGRCPCPRCLLPMDKLHLLGTVQDDAERRALSRIDSNERRASVEAARDLIYNQLYAVGSKKVEDLLSSHSLVHREHYPMLPEIISG